MGCCNAAIGNIHCWGWCKPRSSARSRTPYVTAHEPLAAVGLMSAHLLRFSCHGGTTRNFKLVELSFTIRIWALECNATMDILLISTRRWSFPPSRHKVLGSYVPDCPMWCGASIGFMCLRYRVMLMLLVGRIAGWLCHFASICLGLLLYCSFLLADSNCGLMLVEVLSV